MPNKSKQTVKNTDQTTQTNGDLKHILTGLVVKAVMPQTVTVLVEATNKLHPIYHKKIKRSKKYLVDDSIGVKEGAVVQIGKCRPISAKKHWTILKVVGEDIELIETTAMKETVDEAIAEVMPEEVEETVISSDSEKSQDSESRDLSAAPRDDKDENEKPKKKGKKE